MSNESNRDARTITPSELQASDFFPPGTGWNKDDDDNSTDSPRGANAVDDQEPAPPAPRPN
jgi:hypothetical protein